MTIDITKEEYDSWLDSSEVIENERCTFSSCCGPHSFATYIYKDGMFYELGWGWSPEKTGTEYFYTIKRLLKMPGQEGDGI